MLRCWEWDSVDFNIGEVVGVCRFCAWDGWKWTVVGFANMQKSKSHLVVSGNAAKDVARNKLVRTLASWNWKYLLLRLKHLFPAREFIVPEFEAW